VRNERTASRRAAASIDRQFRDRNRAYCLHTRTPQWRALDGWFTRVAAALRDAPARSSRALLRDRWTVRPFSRTLLSRP